MKARAALFHGVGRPFEVTEIDVEGPGPGEVLVRMAAVGVCGTDLHMVKGEWQRPTPMVLGHEGVGVIEEVGRDVTRLAPGDRVVLSWAPSCGTCWDCRRGSPATCLSLVAAIGAGTLPDGSTGMSVGGERVYRGTCTGALCERISVAERVALPIGGDIPSTEAALLGCAALTGVGAALFAARVAEGATVLVVGAGGVGQFVIQGARIAGAREIVSVDPIAGRRAAALAVGATCAVDADGLADAVAERMPDGAEFAFDAVGFPDTVQTALRHTRSGGLCTIVGLPPAGQRFDIDPAEILRREKRLTGSMYGSTDPAVALPVLVDHVRSGRLDLAAQLGPTFSLDDIDKAIDASLSGSPGRVVVTI